MISELHTTTAEERALVDIQQLPTQVKVIVQLIGIEHAWLFLKKYGGREYTIPVGKHHDTDLHQTLPSVPVALLIGKYAGQRLTVPKPDKIIIQIRNHKIYQARLKGASSAELARRFNLTRRRIISICNAYKLKMVDQPKMDLNHD